MIDDFAGCDVALESLTHHQIAQRLTSACRLRNVLAYQIRDTPASVLIIALEEVMKYLDLVTEQAEVHNFICSFTGRKKYAEQELRILEKKIKAKPGDTRLLNQRQYYWDEITSSEKYLVWFQEKLEICTVQLATLPAPEINGHMTACGVSVYDPLRPPMPTLVRGKVKVSDGDIRKEKRRELRIFVGKLWVELRSRKRGSISTDDDLADLAEKCDLKGFMPNSTYLPESIYKEIRLYNRRDDVPFKITKFSEFIQVFRRKRNKSIPDKRSKKRSSENQNAMRAFRLWLSAAADGLN
jgi:hypothetical protein